MSLQLLADKRSETILSISFGTQAINVCIQVFKSSETGESTTGKAYLASPLVYASELVVFHFQRKHDVVVKAKPDVSGATSRVEVANYFDIGVAHHFSMSSREFEREHLQFTTV